MFLRQTEQWLNSFEGWRFALVPFSHSEDGVACHCEIASFQSFWIVSGQKHLELCQLADYSEANHPCETLDTCPCLFTLGFPLLFPYLHKYNMSFFLKCTVVMTRATKQSWLLLLLLVLTELLEIANNNVVLESCLPKRISVPSILDFWLTADKFCRARENQGQGEEKKKSLFFPMMGKSFFCFPDRHSMDPFHHGENVSESLWGVLETNIVWTFMLLYSSCFWYLYPGRCQDRSGNLWICTFPMYYKTHTIYCNVKQLIYTFTKVI